MRQSLLRTPTSRLFEDFIKECAIVGIDVRKVYPVAKAMLSHASESTRHNADTDMLTKRLELRWYESIKQGEPDYGVYSDDEYLAEAWYCWAKYSREYLRALTSPKLEGDRAPSDVFSPSRIADIGCGVGYTTACLKEMWPRAEVVGTNVEGSKQAALVARMARCRGYKLECGGLDKVGKVDLVFASEYFEHFYEPLAHLTEVLDYLAPEVVVTANAFTSRSTGHFPEYLIDGEIVSNKRVTRRFTQAMNERGYQRVLFDVWNGRPVIWQKENA